MNIISSRNIKTILSYIGQTYHEDVPIPSNWLIPENSDPAKYNDALSADALCPDCGKPILLNKKDSPADLLNTDGMYDCPHCGGRFSHVTRDKGYSHRAMTPGTFDGMGGNNVNNEQMGINYHPGANTNQDTFTSNLGK